MHHRCIEEINLSNTETFMKKIFTQILVIVAIAATSLTAYADRTGYGQLVDLGQLQLDTDYEIKGDFSDYIGVFTATTDGTLIATSTDSYSLYPYREQLDDMESEGNAIEYTLDNPYGAKQYHFDITAGTTYYFYLNFSMSDFTFRLSMDAGNGIAITSVTPEAGSVFSVSGGGLVSVKFNRAVQLDGAAKILGGDKEATVAVNGQNNIYSLEIKEVLFGWLQDGTLKGGDKFTIRLTNVTAADDATIIYGTDGTADIEFIIGEMPVQLVSSENTSGTFKSYYLADDPSGIVTLTFDGEIASALVSLSFGSTDVEGDYYVEDLTPVIEGNTIKVDLTGKSRTPDNMVASGTNYGNVILSFSKVIDKTGQHAYSGGQGTIGGYAFLYDGLEVVTAEVISEFTPAPGSKLDGVAELEIWITDEAKLQYDGVLFKYSNDIDGEKEIVISNDNIKKEADEFDPSAAILTVPVPNEMEGSWNVTVSLYNLVSADGIDHSKDVYAEYFTGDAAVDEVFGDETTEFTVYNTKGILVLYTTNRDEVKNLPNGIYIINGKKFLLNR